jgi:hypothetical protein
MVKCTKRQIRQLKAALHWKMPEAQRLRIQMILLRESGMAQPAIAEAMGVSLKKNGRNLMDWPYDFACELDAVPPDTLSSLVSDAIEQHLDMDRHEEMMVVAEKEREAIRRKK